jgi:hypothetical protein
MPIRHVVGEGLVRQYRRVHVCVVGEGLTRTGRGQVATCRLGSPHRRVHADRFKLLSPWKHFLTRSQLPSYLLGLQDEAQDAQNDAEHNERHTTE